MAVQYKDNTNEIMKELEKAVNSYLYEAGGELQSQTQRNSRVDTGQTKGSYQYEVKTESETGTVYVGSNYENAIWEEFGTGEYALNGDGRKGGWYYVDANGKGHHTYGKKPNRPMYNAFTSLETKLKKRLETVLKGG